VVLIKAEYRRIAVSEAAIRKAGLQRFDQFDTVVHRNVGIDTICILLLAVAGFFRD
jgi:hypothetical protein